jgi:predicted MPP superfamily phosphohydrolase
LLDLAEVNAEQPIIVVDHQPYNLHKSDSLKVDLHLSGHTHRGQVWPASLLTDKMYEQSYGYRKWNHSHIFVSSGLSLWGPPFRIGTNSDLAVINLKGTDAK